MIALARQFVSKTRKTAPRYSKVISRRVEAVVNDQMAVRLHGLVIESDHRSPPFDFNRQWVEHIGPTVKVNLPDLDLRTISSGIPKNKWLQNLCPEFKAYLMAVQPYPRSNKHKVKDAVSKFVTPLQFGRVDLREKRDALLRQRQSHEGRRALGVVDNMDDLVKLPVYEVKLNVEQEVNNFWKKYSKFHNGKYGLLAFTSKSRAVKVAGIGRAKLTDEKVSSIRSGTNYPAYGQKQRRNVRKHELAWAKIPFLSEDVYGERRKKCVSRSITEALSAHNHYTLQQHAQDILFCERPMIRRKEESAKVKGVVVPVKPMEDNTNDSIIVVSFDRGSGEKRVIEKGIKIDVSGDNPPSLPKAEVISLFKGHGTPGHPMTGWEDPSICANDTEQSSSWYERMASKERNQIPSTKLKLRLLSLNNRNWSLGSLILPKKEGYTAKLMRLNFHRKKWRIKWQEFEWTSRMNKSIELLAHHNKQFKESGYEFGGRLGPVGESELSNYIEETAKTSVLVDKSEVILSRRKVNKDIIDQVTNRSISDEALQIKAKRRVLQSRERFEYSGKLELGLTSFEFEKRKMTMDKSSGLILPEQSIITRDSAS